MKIPKHIDHLIYASPTLKEGIESIEQQLGVRPVIGGKHPAFGTHNALLSLGPDIYFEVIAPDPDLASPPQGVLLAEAYRRPPHLATWVLKCDDIDGTLNSLANTSLELGDLQSGSRRTPDGTEINWKLTDPYKLPFGGAVPFLIEWGNTPHPARSLPNAGKLMGITIEHPRPREVRRALSHLDTEVDIIQADSFSLCAVIETSKGPIVLH